MWGYNYKALGVLPSEVHVILAEWPYVQFSMLRHKEQSRNTGPSIQDGRDISNMTKVTGDQQTIVGLTSLVTSLIENVTHRQECYSQVESKLYGLI